MLRGILLGDLGRWGEAQAFLASTPARENWHDIHSYYLGRCYYELKNYKCAKEKLTEALDRNLPRSWENQAHYMLGLTEYRLSNVKSAKQQFELCARTADEKYTDIANLWSWLEATSKALGQFDEADNYHRLMIDSIPKKVN